MLRTSTHGPFTRVWMARTFLGRHLHSVSAYQLGDTLVDSGCAATSRELAAWSAGRGIRRVVHTHHHEDHSGGDWELQRHLAVEIFAPRRTVPILADFYGLPWYRRLVWGRARSATATPFGRSVEIGGYLFRAIPTPGHASDHCCLFQPDQGWLFSGDLYIHPRVIHLRRSEDTEGILESLRTILDLQPTLMLCSHAGFIHNPMEALHRRIRFWEDLGRQASAMASSGESVGAITRRLLGSERTMTVISCGDFSKANLIRALIRSGGGEHRAVV